MINMCQVQEDHITNEYIQEKIHLPKIEKLVAKEQLRWVGKLARMDEIWLCSKMLLSCWINTPHPVRRLQTTNRS
jgi:hypothetical protein